MIKFEKKQVKWISIAIAFVFIGSVVALAVSQSSLGGVASAAGSASKIGVVNYQALLAQHPDMPSAEETLKQETEAAKAEFEEKSKSMNEQEKAEYYQKLQQRLSAKQRELLQQIMAKIDGEIKTVSDARGLSVVLDQNNVVYGGVEITADVAKKFPKQ